MCISVITGALIKIFDDISDNNIDCPSLPLNVLKTTMFCFSTILLMVDISLAFSVACFTIPLCYISNEIDNDDWKSFILVPYFVLLINWDSLYIIYDNLYQICVTDIILSVILVAEAKLFDHEYSRTKLLFRIGALVVFCNVFLYLGNDVAWTTTQIFICLCIGYLTSSVVYMKFFSLPKSE